MVTICTYNARTLASESSIEDLLMQARRIRYEVTGVAETRRRHPFNAVHDTEEELFLGTCDSRGVGGVGVLVNTSSSTSPKTLELIRQCEIARAAGNLQLMSKLAKQSRQVIREDLKEKRTTVMVEAAVVGKSNRKATEASLIKRPR
uniref:Endo/exonuclease/phosphatase domain-containing protein n=1 Tax=Angiostrongylus cantonensis TaxID=6313 RepID=A0A0K0CYV5_ANGCA